MTRPAPKPSGIVLSAAQVTAAEVYANAYRTAETSIHPGRRLAAKDVLRHARAALEPRERAILDMVAGRGATMSELAHRAGASAENLSRLFAVATSKLADALERKRALEEAAGA